MEWFREFAEVGIEFWEIHEDDLVVFHPGVKIGVLHIGLLNDVALVGGGQCKQYSQGGRADGGSESVRVINSKLLPEAFSDESGFVSDNFALCVMFASKNPAAGDDVGVIGGDGESPSV